MKSAIFKRFLFVTGVAMLMFSIVMYYLMGICLLNSTKEQMLSAMYVMDYALDYTDRLQEQLMRLKKEYKQECRITVIAPNGSVCADTQVVETGQLESHLEREEVQQALENGKGYAIRYSETTEQEMLYVALRSENDGYILRLAISFRGKEEFARILIPAILIGMFVVLPVALILSDRLAKSIARPLSKMAGELFAKEEKKSTLAEPYAYAELQIISDSLKQSEERVNQYVEQLMLEKKIRQEFFSNASHELKTPITSIRGYAELLNAGMVQDSMQQRDFLKRIMNETDHMTRLINEILMISRLESNEIEVVKAKVCFLPLVEDIMHELLPVAKKQDVTLKWSCEPVELFASEQQIRELFLNLIQNGIKYNVQGGSVVVSVGKWKDGILIRVEDTGIGIKEEDKLRIFERFYRGDKGRCNGKTGSGLGLAIVKYIVEYYNGTIQVESEWGKGSTFEVYLPK